MTQGAGRIAGGLILLVALWISVYWWWPSAPPVTYAQSDDAIRGVHPKEPPQPKPAEPVKPAPQPPAPKPEARPPQPPPDDFPKLKQAVIPPEFIEHTVQKGETFETIAKKYHGPRAKATLIAAANPMTDPTRLMPGRVILVPKDPGNIQGVPAPRDTQDGVPPSPEEEYIVQEGDTLTRIAQEVYGESRLWTLIRDANRDRLPDEASLKIGQKLRIPARPGR
ncbi:MAG TPA: LysM peptidoglycan-binding domain-containing protein [Phycisphaerales bacterium]|nr:LysM peptidoglycan-binding domain-containing protein [Phycisphaerales bacterium]